MRDCQSHCDSEPSREGLGTRLVRDIEEVGRWTVQAWLLCRRKTSRTIQAVVEFATTFQLLAKDFVWFIVLSNLLSYHS
jgi:hypothetical protein